MYGKNGEMRTFVNAGMQGFEKRGLPEEENAEGIEYLLSSCSGEGGTMRTQYCRIKIVENGEKCKVSPDTIDDLKKVLHFVEAHPECSTLATSAIVPLMAIPDAHERDIAISSVSKAIKSKKNPSTGKFTKRVTKSDVLEIVKKVAPSAPSNFEPSKESLAEMIARVPPGPVEYIPTTPTDVVKPGVLTPVRAPAPVKSQAQIRKERAEMLDAAVTAMLDLMPSVKSRNTIKETLEMYEQFDSQADVISMALDYFEKGWKP
jgi:hypothetical protein